MMHLESLLYENIDYDRTSSTLIDFDKYLHCLSIEQTEAVP